ncbi:MAG: 6-phosphofructokinase [Clostridia bacterium]|nr:6-phosphofructokinase [Clostridia bacterium]
MAQFKKIGVLTSGGDAPGMNPAIRAITRYAEDNGVEVYGIYEGYKGLMEKNVHRLTNRSVSNIVERGGTMLYSARCTEFKEEWAVKQCVENCRELGIDGIVTIGGDGTFRGALDLSEHGIPCIGVPGTIDNDITATEYTLGFDTALNCSVELVDRLRDTNLSHARCSVVEVMGRSTLYLPLHVGIASGASAIIIPGYDYDFDKIVARLEEQRANGKRYFIVVISEGFKGVGAQLATYIEDKSGIETRFTQLGHVVRGGNPTGRDRVLAARMGVKAVELLLAGKSNCIVSLQNDKIIDLPIRYALALDSIYRGKKTPEDYADKFTAEELKSMTDYCDRRNAHFKELFTLNENLTK